MKKNMFVISTIAMLMQCTATAQDTVLGTDRMSNYYYASWWPENLKIDLYGISEYNGPSGGGEFGILFVTPDSLTVYGLAASITDGSHGYRLQDPSYDNSYEYLRIYEAVHAGTQDTLHPIAQTKIHLHTTPIAYYAIHSYLRPPLPMYECYFDSAIVLYDSFYVGMTQFIGRNSSTGGFSTEYDYACPPLSLYEIAEGSYYITQEILYWARGIAANTWETGPHYKWPLLFPILTPPDTTAGIGETSLLDRLTGVMPNPATETARVVSSFGMSRVEAFNLAGERVADIKVPEGSLSATLDVRRWPQGAYILRIHTPQGVASKKLAVKR